MRTLLFLSLLVSSCASIPEGILQLGPRLFVEQNKALPVLQGAPKFIEIDVYPYALNSFDVMKEAKIMLYLGREQIKLESLLEGN